MLVKSPHVQKMQRIFITDISARESAWQVMPVVVELDIDVATGCAKGGYTLDGHTRSILEVCIVSGLGDVDTAMLDMLMQFEVPSAIHRTMPLWQKAKLLLDKNAGTWGWSNRSSSHMLTDLRLLVQLAS